MSKIVKVEVSARHVHLSEQDFETLFGKGKTLSQSRRLLQPGEFKAEEVVRIEGPRGHFEKVAIVGPIRGRTQVEISASDARKLGIAAPIKKSGDLDGTAGCRIVAQSGQIDLAEGVIIAQRHLHLSFEDAKELNLENGDIVKVEVKSPKRSLTFGDVLVRIGVGFVRALHIDTDEANAAGCFGEVYGEIVL